MPYKKKRAIRRRRPARKGMVRLVKRIVNANTETKHRDFAIAGTASSTTLFSGVFTDAAVIPTGPNNGERVGNRIKVLGMRFLLEVDPGDNQNVYRLLLLRRKDGQAMSNSAIPTLLGPVDTERYQVFRDYIGEARFAPVNGSTSDTVSLNKFYKGYIKCPHIVEYNPPNIPPARGGLLGFQFHSDSAVAPNPGLRGYVRVYYKDG